MGQKTHKSVLVKKSTWIISMVACFAFILMAIEVYQVSTGTIVKNLLLVILGIIAIQIPAFLIGWAVSRRRKRPK